MHADFGHPPLQIAVDAVIALLAVHALIKFAFFALPYRMRRDALDRAYGDKPTATRASDVLLLGLVIAIAGLLFWRGVDVADFIGGLWIGATVIQLYFHRFHEGLSPNLAPPQPVSPIKLLSYAIQAAPQRAWRELLVLTVLFAAGLVLIIWHDF